MENQNDKYNIRSLVKAISVLELLVKNEMMSIGELNKETSYGKSTVHRIVGTFKSLNYIDQNPINGKYYATIKLFELGNIVAGRIPIKKIARPYLEELFEECRETVNLAIVDNGEVLYLDKIVTKEPLRIELEVGKRIPSYCSALGKAVIAFNDDLDGMKYDFKKFTEKTIASSDEFEKALNDIRNDGYAYDDEEYVEGLICMAVPILGSDGKAIAAISVAVPKTRLTEDAKTRYLELLKSSARKIMGRSN